MRQQTRLYAFATLVASAAVAVAYVLAGAGTTMADIGGPLPPAVGLLAYVVAISFHADVRFGDQGMRLRPDALPLVYGLVFVPGHLFVIAAVVAEVVAGALAREDRLRVVVNASLAALTSSLAFLAFTAWAPTDVMSVVGVATILAAGVVETGVSLMLVEAIVLMLPSDTPKRPSARHLVITAGLALGQYLVAIPVVAIVVLNPERSWLAIPLIGLALLSVWVARIYGGMYDAQRRMLTLNRRMWQAASPDEVVERALSAAKSLFRADRVMVALPEGAEMMTWIASDDGVVKQLASTRDLDPVMVLVAQQDEPVTLSAQHGVIGLAGCAQVVATPLRLEDGTVGVVLRGNRRATSRGGKRDAMELLHTLALQLGSALSRARLGVRLEHEIADKEHVATHDALTGLPNREYFHQRLTKILDGARHTDGRSAVLLIDLHGFRLLNDTLGHAAGDAVLLEATDRLSTSLRDADVVARVGADEFAVALSRVDDLGLAVKVCERVQEAFERTHNVAGLGYSIRVAIGVALAPEHGDAATELVQRAEVALATSREHQTAWSLFVESDDEDALRRMQIMTDLPVAIADGTIDVHFQPKVAAGTGDVVGFEALARWNHPELGFVSPVDFIPVAETCGQMEALTELVLRRALTAVERWQSSGHRISVAVNISPSALEGVRTSRLVADTLRSLGLSPKCLTLEVTEETLARDPVAAREAVERFTRLGIQLSIDDYGTGYSSLARLLELNTHELKIDRSFIARLLDDPQAAVIIRSTLEMSGALGVATVAEGVEDDQTAELLADMGCDVLQGWLTGRPMDERAATAWLNDPAARWSPPVSGGGTVVSIRR